MLADIKSFFVSWWVFLCKTYESLCIILKKVYTFLRPVENSIKGQINAEEFFRVIMVALSSSGGFAGFVEYLQSHYNDFIVDPNIANGLHAFISHVQNHNLTWALFTTLFILEYLRRKYSHGQ